MKNYELVCILDPQDREEQFEDVIEKYKTYLEENGVEMANIDRWGMRKLAYSSVGMKRRQQGYFVLYQFSAETYVIESLEQELKLDEGVLRYLVVVVGRDFLRVPELTPENEILESNTRSRYNDRRGAPGTRERGGRERAVGRDAAETTGGEVPEKAVGETVQSEEAAGRTTTEEPAQA